MTDVPTAYRLAARFTVALALVLTPILVDGPLHAQGAAAYQVIVNAANPVTELARADVSRWFLRQARKWPDGKVVVPLDQSSRSEVRAAFTLGIHRQPIQAIEAYWQKQIFAGRIVPPFVKVGDADVMSYVAGNTAAIAYVSASATLVPGVKTVRIKE
jgi:hypothetical protein